MKIGVDVETYELKGHTYHAILDATGKYFYTGSIAYENGDTASYDTAEQLWKKILSLGNECSAKKETLYVYMHNAKYDFYNYAKLNDENIKILSEHPFIINYIEYIEIKTDNPTRWMEIANRQHRQYIEKNNKIYRIREKIKFLDTMAILGGSIESLGKKIGIEKKTFIKEFENNLENRRKIQRYCETDSLICVKSISIRHEKLKNEGVNIKRLTTKSQMAIGYVMHQLYKIENKEHIFVKTAEGKHTEILMKPKYRNLIHSAYRGGRTEAWKTGYFEKCTRIDVNSLYPYCISNMKFPNLESERYIKNPLKIYDRDTLLKKIGICRAMLINRKNEHGFLMIRTNARNHTPKIGRGLIGTWTHMEIEYAIKKGYELLDIEWSVIYDEMKNPFKDIYYNIYNKRIETNDEFENLFYKIVLNHSIGKFAQSKENREMFIDNIEEAERYKKQNYDIVKGIDGTNDMMYSKTVPSPKKRYYCPILPCLTTGYGRVYMQKEYEKIPIQDILYTDTDDIIWKGDYIRKFKIGTKIGEFKIAINPLTKEKAYEVPALIYGIKTRMIGNDIAISGIPSKDVTVDNFKTGKIKTKLMLGIKNNETGKFIERERDLVKQTIEHKEIEETLNDISIYRDKNIENIDYFLKHIETFK